MKTADVGVIGGGIVGLATAWALLQKQPKLKIHIFEKEKEVSLHQTGRNSGVLHSGIYYKPHSFKAQLTRIGRKAMIALCEQNEISIQHCGKVIVATTKAEEKQLEMLEKRAVENGISCEKIDGSHLKEIEPHVSGLSAIYVPEVSILDYSEVCRFFCRQISSRFEGQVSTDCMVTGIQERSENVVVSTSRGDYQVRHLISCAGLHSDSLWQMTSQQKTRLHIMPFRGEYFSLKESARHLCRGLIYPVPEPGLPFLGVHFTRKIDGGVECGPNAVLALAKEGYQKTSVQLNDVFSYLRRPGTYRLFARHWRHGLMEQWRSFSRAAFLHALRKLIPAVEDTHLAPGGAGVRAQAVDRYGNLVDDFFFQDTKRTTHVLNAPSPAATASMAIGDHIARRVISKMNI